MDLGLDEFQTLLQSSARAFLARECPPARVRRWEETGTDYDPELWRAMAGMGWMGLLLPEEYGGSGGSLLDMGALYEEMGRALCLTPHLETMLVARALLAAGSAAQKRQYLPAIARGDLVMALALTEPSASYQAEGVQLRATPRDGGFVLDGTKLFVRDADAADWFLVAARTSAEGISLFLVGRDGLTVRPLRTSAGDAEFEVAFASVVAPEGQRVGPLDRGWPIVEQLLLEARALQNLFVVGACARVQEICVEYARQRVQFGRPIGVFQAIQHKLAAMATENDGARLLAYRALWTLSEGGDPPAAERWVAMAKTYIGEVGYRTTLEGQHITGAYGYIKDHDIQLYFRRVKGMELTYGPPPVHRERLARRLAAAGGTGGEGPNPLTPFPSGKGGDHPSRPRVSVPVSSEQPPDLLP